MPRLLPVLSLALLLALGLVWYVTPGYGDPRSVIPTAGESAEAGAASRQAPSLAPEPTDDVAVEHAVPDESGRALVEAEGEARPTEQVTVAGSVVIEELDGKRGGSMEGAQRESGSTDFRLAVPEGPLTLMIFDPDWVLTRVELQAVEGTHHEIELDRAASALLRLVDGEVLVPWPDDDFGMGERLDGAGDLGIRGRAKGCLRYNTAPGRYRVQVPTIQGFLPHDPVEVELVAGEVIEVEIRLVRDA